MDIGGGAEQSVLLIANKLIEKKHDVSILTFYRKNQTYDINSNLKVYSFNFRYSNFIPLKFIYLFILFPIILKFYLMKNSFDTVISNAEDANLVSLICKNFYFLKLNLWIVIRNNNLNNLPKLYFNFIKYLMKKAVKIITVSKTIAYEYKTLGFKNVQCIYNALDLDRINQLRKEKINNKHLFNKKCKYLYFIGSYTDQKNYFFLIDFFKKVNSEDKMIKLVLIGKETKLKKEILKYIKKQNLSNFVIDLGIKKNVFKYLNYADYFILPSKYEGFPRVVLEALSCGVPTICNNCLSGPSEILDNKLIHNIDIKNFYIGEYGLISKYNSVDSMYNAFTYLLSKKKVYEKFKKKSIKRSKDFDINKIIKDWERIL